MSIDLKTRKIILHSDNGAEFLSDSGVMWIDILRKNADKNVNLRRDWEIIKNWLNRSDDGDLNTEEVQRLGEAWMAYYAIGVAPSFALQPMFDKVSQQESMKGYIGKKVPTEVMDVFDRTQASDAEISQKRAHDIAEAERKLKDVFDNFPQQKRLSVKGKFSKLPKSARFMISISILWFAWVVLRTSGSYEFLGTEFYQWEEDMFFANLLLPPLGVALLYGLYCWVTAAQR